MTDPFYTICLEYPDGAIIEVPWQLTNKGSFAIDLRNALEGLLCHAREGGQTRVTVRVKGLSSESGEPLVSENVLPPSIDEEVAAVIGEVRRMSQRLLWKGFNHSSDNIVLNLQNVVRIHTELRERFEALSSEIVRLRRSL